MISETTKIYIQLYLCPKLVHSFIILMRTNKTSHSFIKIVARSAINGFKISSYYFLS